MLSCEIISLSPAAKLHTAMGAVAAPWLSTTAAAAAAALFAMWQFTLDKPKLLVKAIERNNTRAKWIC